MFPGRRQLVPGPPSRIELHTHLDGCVRHETIWELMKQKKLPLPGDGTFQALREALVIRDPKNLAHFLAPFGIYTNAIAGDLHAIERVAYEFGMDKSRCSVLYVEARFAPHFWIDPSLPKERSMDKVRQVVGAVHRGFARAEKESGIVIRSILCVLNGMGFARETLQLCEEYHHKGVVGIDMAACSKMDQSTYEEVPLTPEEMEVFNAAKDKGIHRTVHAGESGGPVMVLRAVENYHAERIGHGYHVLEDNAVYKMCQSKDIHFECCPWSSLLTGSVPAGVLKHPIARFAEDGVNFSLNTDDTTITGMSLEDDYELSGMWGLTEAHMVRSNLNALRSSFLPETEKNILRERLLQSFGIDEIPGE